MLACRKRLVLKFLPYVLCLCVLQCHLAEHAHRPLGSQLPEVLFPWGDDEACHVESPRTNEALLHALGEIAVGTVLCPWNDHRDVVVATSPSYDVHHWLRVVAVERHHVVEAVEQPFLRLWTMAAEQQCKAEIVAYLPYSLKVVQGKQRSEVAAQSLPTALQWHKSARSCLEMGMVGSRGSTFRTIVEHHLVRIVGQHPHHLVKVAHYPLWLMLLRRYGEMGGKYGVWVDEKLEALVNVFLELVGRAVCLAEEACPAAECLLVYLRSC